MRINKYLAKVGVASRRQAEEVITAGRVTINGEVCVELSTKVDVDKDSVCVDAKPVSLPESTTIVALNKPKGFLCTQFDPQQRDTVYNLMPKSLHSLHYIGRLDYQSRGLLLFTDDGELSRRLTLPKYEIPRYYEVVLNHVLDVEAVAELKEGLLLEDGTRFRSAGVKVFGKKVEMRLVEGKKREIREMMKHLGYKVVDLKRVSYSEIKLGDLEEGQWRELLTEEVDELYRTVGLEKK